VWGWLETPTYGRRHAGGVLRLRRVAVGPDPILVTVELIWFPAGDGIMDVPVRAPLADGKGEVCV